MRGYSTSETKRMVRKIFFGRATKEEVYKFKSFCLCMVKKEFHPVKRDLYNQVVSDNLEVAYSLQKELR